MFKRLAPTWQIESIYNLTAADLHKNNIKVVLTDLDNTLIAWNNPDGTPELRAWLRLMEEEKITVVVVSNNNHQRVKRAVGPLNLPFVSRALKPLTRGIRQAQKRYQVANDEVILVGDQLLTDVWAANNAQIRSVLVKPIVESDAWNTKINRGIENLVKGSLYKQKFLSKNWRNSLDDRA